MLSRTAALRWRTVLLAAARLAGLYALGTTVLLLPFFIVLERPALALGALGEFAMPIGFAFAVAFVLLAAARRAGLVALWLVLAGLWALALRASVVGYTEEFAIAFVFWSALAIPLALLGGIGVPATLRVRVGRWRLTVLSLTVILWTALLIPALARFAEPAFRVLYYPQPDVTPLSSLKWFAWALGAPLLVALSIAHIWVGTAPAKVKPPAA